MIWKKSGSTPNRGVALYLVIATVVMGFIVPAAHAGTVIELSTVYFDESKPTEDTIIYLDGDRMRFESVENGKEMTLIVTLDDAGEPICWVIDRAAKTYTEITRARADQVKSQIEQGKKQMEARLENVPPQQRDQVRQMMKSQLEQFDKAANITFKKIASGVEIKNWNCVQYESILGEEKHEDIWAVEWKQIGLERSDASIFRKLGSLFEGISPETNAYFHTGGSAKTGQFDGFPVLVVEYKEGQKHEKSEVRTISSKPLEDSLFTLPEGYTQVSLFER
ncbi:MAG: DUF4412 domain-containing protein [bacterium]